MSDMATRKSTDPNQAALAKIANANLIALKTIAENRHKQRAECAKLIAQLVATLQANPDKNTIIVEELYRTKSRMFKRYDRRKIVVYKEDFVGAVFICVDGTLRCCDRSGTPYHGCKRRGYPSCGLYFHPVSLDEIKDSDLAGLLSDLRGAVKG